MPPCALWRRAVRRRPPSRRPTTRVRAGNRSRLQVCRRCSASRRGPTRSSRSSGSPSRGARRRTSDRSAGERPGSSPLTSSPRRGSSIRRIERVCIRPPATGPRRAAWSCNSRSSTRTRPPCSATTVRCMPRSTRARAGCRPVSVPGAAAIGAGGDGYRVAVLNQNGCVGAQLVERRGRLRPASCPERPVRVSPRRSRRVRSRWHRRMNVTWLWAGDALARSEDGGATWL